MDWMYSNCSTTAQRGALDWKPRFKKAVLPVFNELYESVKAGKETEIVIRVNSAPDYREKLEAELKVMGNSEMWQAGAAVRSLRPENWKKTAPKTKAKKAVKKAKKAVAKAVKKAKKAAKKSAKKTGKKAKRR